MDTIFRNSENIKTSDFHILLLNLSDKIDLKRSDKYVALSNHSKYYTWKNVKKSNKNNKVQRQREFDLSDGPQSVLDIRDYFEYIIKKHDNPPIRIYINKIEHRITFKIKTEYYLKLLTPGAMKLHGSTKSKITKDENGENVPYLEITEIVLVHSNIANNDYQQDSKVFYMFVPNKSFCQL